MTRDAHRPRTPPSSADEEPKVGHRYATARMAAAEEPKIIARFMLRLLTLAQRFLDVLDDILGLYGFTVVFAYYPPIRTDQHHGNQVPNRTVRLDLPAELETGQRLVDVRRPSGQEIPSLLICALLMRVIEQLFRPVMFGIDRDRNQRHLRTEIVTQPQRDVRKLCSLHQARTGARRIDEIHHHRLALERLEQDGVAILIDELGVRGTLGPSAVESLWQPAAANKLEIAISVIPINLRLR